MSGRRHVVVCGTGMAGLSAALAALESGADVTVLEKAPTPGGTTALSDGVIWTLATFDDMTKVAPKADQILQRVVLDNIAADRAWLERQGVQLAPLRPVQAIGLGQNCDPKSLVRVLLERITALGGRVCLETALDELMTEDGRVIGVRTVRETGPGELRADAVILATGGFQGNPDLVARYIVADPSNILLRASPWSTGDALLAATGIGAALTSGLNTFYGHALAAPPAEYLNTNLKEVTQYYGPLSVVLNLRGDRFADESAGLATKESELSQQLALQPEGKGFYVIDSRIADMEVMPNSGLITKAVVERARKRGAPVASADSLEELCAAMEAFGVPSYHALQTLREYNANIAGGTPERLRPPRTTDRFPITAPPFFAVGVQAGITFTMGGLAVDSDMCVLRRSGGSSPLAHYRLNASDVRLLAIPGLYAAGCDVGNISHFGYMGSLGPALVTGRIAGANAARGTSSM